MITHDVWEFGGAAEARSADVAAESELELTADALKDRLFLHGAATVLASRRSHYHSIRGVLVQH